MLTNQRPQSTYFPLLIFSSHSWAHGHHRTALHGLLAPEWRKETDFVDLSVSSAHPLPTFGYDIELAEQLADRIKDSDVLLVMAGMYANQSDWMRAEIAFAIAHKKPILAIAPFGQERVASTATRFSRYPAVRWRGSSIRSAILDVIDPHVRASFEAARQERIAQALERALRKDRHSQSFAEILPLLASALPRNGNRY